MRNKAEIMRTYDITEEIYARAEMLEKMHDAVMMMNDETAYMSWIWLVPDCPDFVDFIDFARDFEDFTEVMKKYYKLIVNYGEFSEE